MAFHDVGLRMLLTSDLSKPTEQWSLEDVLPPAFDTIDPAVAFSRVSLRQERARKTRVASAWLWDVAPWGLLSMEKVAAAVSLFPPFSILLAFGGARSCVEPSSTVRRHDPLIRLGWFSRFINERREPHTLSW